jgi:hypothetical protein
MRAFFLIFLLSCIPQFVNAETAIQSDCPVPGATFIPTPKIAAILTPEIATQSTKLLADLPPSVMAALREHIPDLAPADAPINLGDIDLGGLGVPRLPTRRFLFAFHRGARWTVAYEAGGRAGGGHLVALQLSSDTQTVQVLANIQEHLGSKDFCTDMIAWLNPDYPVDRYW